MLFYRSDVLIRLADPPPPKPLFTVNVSHTSAPFTVREPSVTAPFGMVLLADSVSCVPFKLYVKLSSYATVVTCVGLKDWPLLPPT